MCMYAYTDCMHYLLGIRGLLGVRDMLDAGQGIYNIHLSTYLT